MPLRDPTADIARPGTSRCSNCFSAGVRDLILWHPRRSGGRVRRREFIALVAGAGAWPLATRAQQAGLPTIGFLATTSAATATYFVGFRDGLKDGGYAEGQNLAIEYRWAEGQYDRLPILAAELVR